MKKRRTRWKKVRILAAKKQALRRKKEIFVTLYSSCSRDVLFIVESALSSPVTGTALK